MFHKSIILVLACTLLSVSADMATPMPEGFKFKDKVVPPERENKQIFLPSGMIQMRKADGTIGERLPAFKENIQTFTKKVRGVGAPVTRVLGDNMIKIAGNAAFVPSEGRKAVYKSCSIQRNICQIANGGSPNTPRLDCQETFKECITIAGLTDLMTPGDLETLQKAGVSAPIPGQTLPPPAANSNQPPAPAAVSNPAPAPAAVSNPAPAPAAVSNPAPAPAASSSNAVNTRMAPPAEEGFKYTDGVVPDDRINKTILLPNGMIQVKKADGTIGERLPVISEALQTFKGLAKGVKAPNIRLLGDNKLKIAGNAQFEPSQGRQGVLKSCQIQRDMCEFRGGQSVIDPICEGVFMECVDATGLRDIVPAAEIERAQGSTGVVQDQQQSVSESTAEQDQQAVAQNNTGQVQQTGAQNDVPAGQNASQTSTSASQCAGPTFVTVTVQPVV